MIIFQQNTKRIKKCSVDIKQLHCDAVFIFQSDVDEMLSYCLRVALALVSSPRFRSEVSYHRFLRSSLATTHCGQRSWVLEQHAFTFIFTIILHSTNVPYYVLFVAGFARFSEEVRGAPYSRLHQCLSGKACPQCIHW